MTKKLLALYGSNWNPFAAEVPLEALIITPKVDAFCWRIEQGHVRDDGGDPFTDRSSSGREWASRFPSAHLIGTGARPLGLGRS